jgi:hypothetical protein
MDNTVVVPKDSRQSLKDYFETLSEFYEDSDSQSAGDKAKKYFRIQYAQTLFRKEFSITTIKNPVADHILCIGVFKRLLLCFPKSLTYSYEWYSKIKVSRDKK